MGERPDEVRREVRWRSSLDRRDTPGGGSGQDVDPLASDTTFDPATDAFEPEALNPPPGSSRDEAEVVEVDEAEVDDVEVTRIEIERTRAEMSETVDAIQERLNPENLKEQAKDRIQEVAVEVRDQAKDKVREATVGTAQDAGSGIVGIIRNNPVPSALTSVGLGWLLVNSRRQGSEQPEVRRTPDYAAYGGYSSAYGASHDSPSRYEEREESEGSSAGGALNRVQGKVGEAAGQVQDRAGDLASQAQDRAGQVGGQAKQTGSTLVDSIRENPVPAALAGLGLGWLLVSSRQQGSGQAQVHRRTYDSSLREGERGTDDSSAGQALGQARDRVGETASQAQDKAGQVAGQAQDQVGRLGNQAQRGVRRASGGFQRILRENPLAVGVLAAGVGAAAGLAIPGTNKEHEVMGEARDTLVEKTQEKVQETQQKVQQVAGEVQSAAQQEAQNQGLTDR